VTLRKELCPRYNTGKELLFKHKPLLALLLCRAENRGGINPSELSFLPPANCSWHRLVPILLILLGHPASVGSMLPCKPQVVALTSVFCAYISSNCLGGTISRTFQSHFIFSHLHLFLKTREVTKRFFFFPSILFLVGYSHSPKYSHCWVEK